MTDQLGFRSLALGLGSLCIYGVRGGTRYGTTKLGEADEEPEFKTAHGPPCYFVVYRCKYLVLGPY
ncbi:BCCT family transporter [Vibrio chagasii]|nr:BCCT family transporter [Vibrio chagasii]